MIFIVRLKYFIQSKKYVLLRVLHLFIVLNMIITKYSVT